MSAAALADANVDILCTMEAYNPPPAAATTTALDHDHDAARRSRAAAAQILRFQNLKQDTAAAAVADSASTRLALSQRASADTERRADEARQANLDYVVVA